MPVPVSRLLCCLLLLALPAVRQLQAAARLKELASWKACATTS